MEYRMLRLPTWMTGISPLLVRLQSVLGEILSAREVSSAVSNSWGLMMREAWLVAHNEMLAMKVQSCSLPLLGHSR